MTGWQTTAPSGIPGWVPTDNTCASNSDLRGSAFLAIGPAMPRVAVCEGMTNRTGTTDMFTSVVLSCPVRERGACRPPGIRITMAVRASRIRRRIGVQVASATIWWESRCYGIGSAGSSLYMAPCRYASRPIGGSFVRRSGVWE
jgi:hypothetical protein